jgi:cellobiose-specific phosphotransferase system component IIC
MYQNNVIDERIRKLMNIVGIADSTANQRHVAAVRRGVLLNMPLVVIGAFATMMSEVSILWYQ